jgi:hypothetical protein
LWWIITLIKQFYWSHLYLKKSTWWLFPCKIVSPSSCGSHFMFTSNNQCLYQGNFIGSFLREKLFHFHWAGVCAGWFIGPIFSFCLYWSLSLRVPSLKFDKKKEKKLHLDSCELIAVVFKWITFWEFSYRY